MVNHERFTVGEANNTEGGRIRGVILDEIASRCGSPDSKLLDGIEAAARRLAAERSRHIVIGGDGTEDIADLPYIDLDPNVSRIYLAGESRP